MLELHDYFSADGELSKKIPHYQYRDGQRQMADAVASAIENSTILLCEAGTGIGKTYAYLLPALQGDHKVLISTGTKTLQDQLFFRDLPTVRRVISSYKKLALLKGRNNYLCLHYYDQHVNQGVFTDPHLAKRLAKMKNWSQRTKDGDLTAILEADNDPLRPLITSTKDNCLGQECAFFEPCFLQKARKKAQKADIIVINHHLFFANFALQDEGLGELFPQVDVFIFDEAHQLPDVALQFLGHHFSTRLVNDLMDDVIIEQQNNASDDHLLAKRAEAILGVMESVRSALPSENTKAVWQPFLIRPEIQQGMQGLLSAFNDLAVHLDLVSDRSKLLKVCHRRCLELLEVLPRFVELSASDQVRWLETYSKTLILKSAPLKLAEQLEQYFLDSESAWIMTSATLAIRENFSHYREQMGLLNVEVLEACFESPFDYAKQLLLYVPRGMPDPNQANYTQACVEAAMPLIEAAQGRTFFLFTSHYALQIAANLLKNNSDYHWVVQGEFPKARLIESFLEKPRSVLLGTASFWEGVDVRGTQLSCVIIDKLPFTSPQDPVSEARVKALREAGRDPFNDYQMPQAIQMLKQGSGRLIRDTRDEGVLMICDPRLVAREYGAIFLESLPQSPRTREASIACERLARIAQSAEVDEYDIA